MKNLTLILMSLFCLKAHADFSDLCYAKVYEKSHKADISRFVCVTNVENYRIKSPEALDCLLTNFNPTVVHERVRYCNAKVSSDFQDVCFATIFENTLNIDIAQNLCVTNIYDYVIHSQPVLNCVLKKAAELSRTLTLSQNTDRYTADGVYYCNAAVKGGMDFPDPTAPAVPVRPVTLPDQTQVLLLNEVSIASDESCGAPKSGIRDDLQCWVCQGKTSNNDRMLDAGTATEPRTMIISSAQVKEKEIDFTIVDDPSIKAIRCISPTKLQNLTRESLIKTFANNNMKLVIPPPVKE